MVDWSLAVTVTILVGTGLYSLLVGDPSGAWVFDVHAIATTTQRTRPTRGDESRCSTPQWWG